MKCTRKKKTPVDILLAKPTPQLLVALLALLGIGGFTAGILENPDLLGCMCLFMVFFLFASPLSTLAAVVKTSDSSSISRYSRVLGGGECD